MDARDPRGRSPLHLAAGAGCSDMVALFLERSQQWDAADSSGWTPLFWACSRGHGALHAFAASSGGPALAGALCWWACVS